VGEALILQLDQVHDNDPRILELALIFEKAIQVINEEITNQNTKDEVIPNFQPVRPEEERGGDFLVARKIGGQGRDKASTPEPPKQTNEPLYE
jgi:hypothetical protein